MKITNKMLEAMIKELESEIGAIRFQAKLIECYRVQFCERFYEIIEIMAS